MKQLVILLVAIALFPFHFSSCIDEGGEVLPEVTMEGKNTFGCLVNGEVWLPKGKPLDFKLDLSYDPYYKGGTFNLRAKRNLDDFFEGITIAADSLNSTGEYPISHTSRINVLYTGTKTGCDAYFKDETDVYSGWLEITKLDIEEQIISGLFEFEVHKTGCDTIKVTHGRFDMKI